MAGLGHSPIMYACHTGNLMAVLPLNLFIIFGAEGNSKKPWLFGFFGFFWFFCFLFFKSSNKSGSSFASVNRSWSQGANLECAAEQERAGHGPQHKMEEKVPGAKP